MSGALLVPYRAVVAQAINATASFVSGVMDCRRFTELKSLVLNVSGSAPDMKIEYAGSPDGVTFESFDSETDLVASTAALPTTTGINVIDLTSIKRPPYMKIKVTGLAGNGANSVISVDVNGQEL